MMKFISIKNTNEQLVLALWVCNQTIKESARYLKLSEKTIEYYRNRLKDRLEVNSSNEFLKHIILSDEYETLMNMGKNFLINSSIISAQKIQKISFQMNVSKSGLISQNRTY